MRPIGFSTGAIALGDFSRALDLLRSKGTDAIELSALRSTELVRLISALPSLDLSTFRHVSLHAPSSITPEFESTAVKLLESAAERGWLVIVHPDVIVDRQLWDRLGPYLCIENMDKRKPIGQTADQLARVFDDFPEATFCFDLGHARQVDPTMTEAFMMVRMFLPRLRQLHISEVNSESRHAELTVEAMLAFRRVAAVLPSQIPVIIESRITEPYIVPELRLVRDVLGTPDDAGVGASDFTAALSA